MLHTLKLTNFKRHTSLEVDLHQGLNVVTGANYKGKSSLLEGVNYAFWGPSAVPGGAAVCLHRGANKLRVEVDFTVSGTRYTVSRTASTATLRREGEIIAKSASVVSQELEHLLGISRRRFLQLHYGSQKNTEALLTMGAPELHRVIEEICGVELVNKVLAKAKTRATGLQAVVDSLPVHDLEADDLDVTEAEGQVQTLTAALETPQAALAKAVAELRTASAAVDAAVRHNRNIREVLTHREHATTYLAQAEKDLAQAQASLQQYPASLDADVAALTAQRNTSTAELHTLSDTLRTLEDTARRLDEKQAAVAKHTVEVERLQAEVTPGAQDAAGQALKEAQTCLTQAQADEAKALFARDATAAALKGAACPTCHRPFEDHDPAKLQAELAELEAGLVARVQARKEALQVVHDTSAALEKIDQHAFKLQHYLDTRAIEQEAVTALEAKLTSADLPATRQAIGVCQAALTQAEMKLRALNLDVGLRDKEKAIVRREKCRVDALRTTLADIHLPEEGERDEDALMATRDALQADVDSLGPQVQTLSDQLAQWKQAKTDRRRVLDEHKASNTKRDTLQTELKVVETLQKYLRDNRDRFVSGVWAGLTRFASGFVSAATGGYISDLHRTPEGEFMYTEGENEFPVVAASGAQKSILGLGVQAALSQLLPSGFSCLMLDEPTADMDPEHALATSSLLKGLGGQCVMITHREMDASIASHSIILE